MGRQVLRGPLHQQGTSLPVVVVEMMQLIPGGGVARGERHTYRPSIAVELSHQVPEGPKLPISEAHAVTIFLAAHRALVEGQLP